MNNLPPKDIGHLRPDLETASAETLNERGRVGQCIRRGVAYIAPLLAYFALTQVTYYQEDLKTMNDSGPIMIDIDGCDPFPILETLPTGGGLSSRPKLTKQQIIDTTVIETVHKETVSAARNTNVEGVNPLKTLFDIYTIETTEVTRFTSNHSGIDFIVHSDAEEPFKTDIETDTLDNLIHAGFRDDVTYPHAIIQAAVDCGRERFIEKNEFAGDQINLFIASDPRTCWKNLIIQIKPKDLPPEEKFCDSKGGSYHKVSAGIVPYAPIYQKRWSAVLVANHNKKSAHQKVSEDIQHEVFGHLFLQMMGLTFRFDPDEAAAQEIENSIRKSIYLEKFDVNGEKKVRTVYPEFLTFHDKYFDKTSN